MKSVMQHQFSQVPSVNIPRSTFNRSHGHKTTFQFGDLIPIYWDEVYPGDTFNMKASLFGRMATPIKPVMDNMYLDFQVFFVPYRLLWNNFQKFMGEQDNPNDSTDFLTPQIVSPTSAGFGEDTLYDYFGIPPKVGQLSVNALPLRAYNLIYNEWYRSENIQNSVAVPKGDGPDTYTDFVLKKRGKRFDYFTSCLPFAQKGPDVLLPLGSQAPVKGIGKRDQSYTFTDQIQYETGGSSSTTYPSSARIDNNVSAGQIDIQQDPNNPGFPGIFADLTNATASTINALREAFQLQKLYERDARGGTRYRELIKAHYNVDTGDARVNRPELLHSSTTPMNVHQVPQQSPSGITPELTPQGNLAAFGTVSASDRGFTKSFTEHGVIIGIVSARADLTYQQGLNRMWSRRTKYDYYWPALAHLGEQAVLNKEIFAQGEGNPTQDEAVFGYNERWAELRYHPSIISGKFRTDNSAKLDVWHLSQHFGSLPALNDAFIIENPPVNRVIAVPAEPHIILDSYFNLRCARPMPLYSVPGLIDHF